MALETIKDISLRLCVSVVIFHTRLHANHEQNSWQLVKPTG
jgi:hypothetical protein